MVVLHELHVPAHRFVERLLIEAFQEESARVAKDLRLDDEYVGDRCGGHFHERISSASRWLRYLP